MAVAAGVLSETQRRTLEAVCDTYAPSVEVETDDAVRKAFFARAASELGVAAQIEGLMADAMVGEEIAGFAELLDALAEHDLALAVVTLHRDEGRGESEAKSCSTTMAAGSCAGRSRTR